MGKLCCRDEVDLALIQGTGVGGRIRKQDVLAAAELQRPPPLPVRSTAAAGFAAATSAAPVPSLLRGKTE